MKAMILAAGLGKRMRPLTDTLPKPLLPVGGKPLLVYHLERLRERGVTEFIINTAYLGKKIEAVLGDGSAYGVSIQYSREQQPLETGGGLLHALPLLGEEPFLLVNGDIWTDYPFERLLDMQLPDHHLGHLVLVPNPRHHQQGDFALHDGLLLPSTEGDQGFTFSGISLLRPQLIGGYSERRPKFPLREALAEGMTLNQLHGEIYPGQWWDVGTPERLQELDVLLSSR
jgi:MurNAc alpha-1-phosphate uridylyltransferase